MKSERKIFYTLLLMFLVLIILSVGTLLFGDVPLNGQQLINAIFKPFSDTFESNIIWQLRFPKMMTGLLAGGGLALAGLLMQTFFQNPLAGPFVLGINSGASLGVALWLLGSSFLGAWIEPLLPVGAILFAILGSLLILLLLLFLSFKFQGKVILLVMGLMFGHLANGLINVFISVGQMQKIKIFLFWGLGSFARVDQTQLPIFASVMLIAIALSFLQVKRLNLLMLGDRYARSLGLNLSRSRISFIAITGILSGVVTACCGPIAFLGVMGPHLARAVVKTSDHRYLLPASFLMGAIIAIGADALCFVFPGEALPLNAMMGILGAPVIIYFLWARRHGEIV